MGHLLHLWSQGRSGDAGRYLRARHCNEMPLSSTWEMQVQGLARPAHCCQAILQHGCSIVNKAGAPETAFPAALTTSAARLPLLCASAMTVCQLHLAHSPTESMHW